MEIRKKRTISGGESNVGETHSAMEACYRSRIHRFVQFLDLLSYFIVIRYELRVMLNSVLDTCSVLLGTLNQPEQPPSVHGNV